MRGSALLATACVLVAAAPSPSSAASALGREAYEARLLASVNAERARHGLRRLVRTRCAGGFASRWAERIAREQSLHHQPVRKVLATCEARRAAENIARGTLPPEGMARLWMKSRPHRANILDPRLTHAALSARRAPNGDWYAVQVFLGY